MIIRNLQEREVLVAHGRNLFYTEWHGVNAVCLMESSANIC